MTSPREAADVTIPPAMDAAACPPYPAFSTITAKAMRRVAGPAGANPTNHECDAAPATSAVPVLPAMRDGWFEGTVPCR